MKTLLILITSLFHVLCALALEKGDELRYLRTRGTRNICIDTGKRTGNQTLEVPKKMVGFFTSKRRTNPAKVCLRYLHMSIIIPSLTTECALSIFREESVEIKRERRLSRLLIGNKGELACFAEKFVERSTPQRQLMLRLLGCWIMASRKENAQRGLQLL